MSDVSSTNEPEPIQTEGDPSQYPSAAAAASNPSVEDRTNAAPLEPNHQNDPDTPAASRPVALITDPAPLPPDTALAQVVGTPGPLGLGGANDPDNGGVNAWLRDHDKNANQGTGDYGPTIEPAAGLPSNDKTSEDYFRSDVLDTSTDATPGPNEDQVFPTGSFGPVGEQEQPTGQPVDEIDASHEAATSANVVDPSITEAATSGSAQDANTNQQEAAAAPASTSSTDSSPASPAPEGAAPEGEGVGATTDVAATDPVFTSKVDTDAAPADPPRVVDTPANELQDPTNTVLEASEEDAAVVSGTQPAAGIPIGDGSEGTTPDPANETDTSADPNSNTGGEADVDDPDNVEILEGPAPTEPEPAPAPSEQPAPEQPTTAPEPDPAPDFRTEKPAVNDRKEEWYSYARGKGFNGEYETTTKAQLIEQYGDA